MIMSVCDMPRGQVIVSKNSLVYNTPVINQLYGRFVVHIRIISAAKVADAEQKFFKDQRRVVSRGKRGK